MGRTPKLWLCAQCNHEHRYHLEGKCACLGCTCKAFQVKAGDKERLSRWIRDHPEYDQEYRLIFPDLYRRLKRKVKETKFSDNRCASLVFPTVDGEIDVVYDTYPSDYDNSDTFEIVQVKYKGVDITDVVFLSQHLIRVLEYTLVHPERTPLPPWEKNIP